MYNSKLIDLLRPLSKQELKFFGKYFVQNPYRNSNIPAQQLFTLLCKYHPDFTDKRLEKEKVFKKLFPKLAVYHKQKLLGIMHTLAALVEQYLVELKLEKKQMNREMMLLEVYKERGMDKQFFQQAKQIQRRLAQQTERDMDYHYQMHYLNRLVYAHPETSKLQANEESFKHALQHLDAFYFSSLLIGCLLF